MYISVGFGDIPASWLATENIQARLCLCANDVSGSDPNQKEELWTPTFAICGMTYFTFQHQALMTFSLEFKISENIKYVSKAQSQWHYQQASAVCKPARMYMSIRSLCLFQTNAL